MKMTDDELLRSLRMLARSRRLNQSSNVQIDSGNDEPPKPLSEEGKARLQRVWSQLSDEDQRAVAESFDEREAKWLAWHSGRG
jgi:hypothetical protein